MPVDPNSVDFTSDLNGTGDTTVAVHESDVGSHGQEVVPVNNQNPAREPTAKPKVIDTDKPAGEKPLSIRDQISSALKGEDGTPPAASQDGGPARNPDGTFAPKAAADPAAPVDPAAPPVDPAAAPVLAAPQGIDPEVFKSLPAETQAHLARTMDDINARQQRIAALEPIEQLIAPRIDAWALNGMMPSQALHQLLALSDFAGRDLPGFIRYMADNSGLDLMDLVLQDDKEPADPKYAALEKQVRELQQGRTLEQQQQQQAAHNSRVDSIIAFASEKGPEGQLLRPYFDDLGEDVLPFISAAQARNPTWTQSQILQDAYDRACWGSPSVRAKMQAATNAAGEAERLRAETERVDKARTASASVKSGVPASPPVAPDAVGRSLRDTIKASMAAAT